MSDPMDSPLWRWSRLYRSANRWRVHVTYHGTVTTIRTSRAVRWWSPRDLVRFPLFWLWERRYW